MTSQPDSAVDYTLKPHSATKLENNCVAHALLGISNRFSLVVKEESHTWAA